MSAFADDPGHFVRYLEREGLAGEAPGDGFAARRDYGRYLRATLEALPARDALEHLRERAVAVEPAGDGYRVRLASGATLHGARVVLAIGNAPRALPPFLLHPGARVAEAWDYEAVRRIPADADACILGSGLSMVDAALSLAHGGHRGRIQVLSRHGLLPLAHASTGPHGGGVDDLLAMGLRERWRELRSRVAAAVAAGEPWQWTFDRLRPHGQALWRSLDAGARRRFLRHAVRYWDIHRHRIAPQVEAALARLRDSGQLTVVAGRLRATTIDPGGGSHVHYRPRHAAFEARLHADWIINATGVETNIDLRPDPLLRSLREGGLVIPGPLGIGIATAGIGEAINRRGRPDPRLLVLGAMRIGDLWESIAIPELREQARLVAGTILDAGPVAAR